MMNIDSKQAAALDPQTESLNSEIAQSNWQHKAGMDNFKIKVVHHNKFAAFITAIDKLVVYKKTTISAVEWEKLCCDFWQDYINVQKLFGHIESEKNFRMDDNIHQLTLAYLNLILNAPLNNYQKQEMRRINSELRTRLRPLRGEIWGVKGFSLIMAALAIACIVVAATVSMSLFGIALLAIGALFFLSLATEVCEKSIPTAEKDREHQKVGAPLLNKLTLFAETLDSCSGNVEACSVINSNYGAKWYPFSSHPLINI